MNSKWPCRRPASHCSADFLSRQCGYNDATVVFGAADGSKRLEIVLTDTGLPAPPTEGDAVAYRAARTSCAG